MPIVIDLLHPNSVVDVGCGTGGWLAEFKRHGVTNILGIDGPHIPIGQLEFDPREFLAADLTEPLRLDSYFDLAISLEVAEHLEVHRSEQFVETLTDLAPIVLFSAAIPHQGGPARCPPVAKLLGQAICCARFYRTRSISKHLGTDRMLTGGTLKI